MSTSWDCAGQRAAQKVGQWRSSVHVWQRQAWSLAYRPPSPSRASPSSVGERSNTALVRVRPW